MLLFFYILGAYYSVQDFLYRQWISFTRDSLYEADGNFMVAIKMRRVLTKIVENK